MLGETQKKEERASGLRDQQGAGGGREHGSPGAARRLRGCGQSKGAEGREGTWSGARAWAVRFQGCSGFHSEWVGWNWGFKQRSEWSDSPFNRIPHFWVKKSLVLVRAAIERLGSPLIREDVTGAGMEGESEGPGSLLKVRLAGL